MAKKYVAIIKGDNKGVYTYKEIRKHLRYRWQREYKIFTNLEEAEAFFREETKIRKLGFKIKMTRTFQYLLYLSGSTGHKDHNYCANFDVHKIAAPLKVGQIFSDKIPILCKTFLPFQHQCDLDFLNSAKRSPACKD